MNPELLTAVADGDVLVIAATAASVALIDPTVEEKRIAAMVISPEQAQYFLKRFNSHNRTFKDKSVIDQSTALRDGTWRYNYSPIVFDWDRELMDGQNRLAASVRTNLPITSDVVFGLDPALRSTYDAVSRSVADMVVMGSKQHRPTHPQQAAAVARMLETVRRQGMRGLWSPKLFAPKQAIATAITNGYYPLLDRASQVAARASKVPNCHSRIAGFCWYKFAEKDQATAHRFIELFLTGVELSTESPILCLRNQLLLNSPYFKKEIALFIKAWNLFRQGLPCKRITWRDDASNPETFPEIL